MVSADISKEVKKQYDDSGQQNTNKQKEPKYISREIGLEISAICGKHLLKLEHLHYGYWTKDLQVDITNLHIAQENYADFLISHIPKNIKTILDVGCGTGRLAGKLVDMEYQVDCVSPSPFLADCTREVLPSKFNIFECDYEQLQTENRYDVILFSESFQYIDVQEALEKSLSLLNPDGYLLICDVFKTAVQGKSPISGGHSLAKFYNIIAKYPLGLVKNLDITEETAPNIDIENHMCKEVVHPVVNLVQQLLDNRYPLMSKFVKWRYKKKIDKIYRKYFSDERNGENFKKFRSYRVLLYKKINSK